MAHGPHHDGACVHDAEVGKRLDSLERGSGYRYNEY